MEKTSWVCTLVTQVCLCLALYGALNIGMPQRSVYSTAIRGGGRPLDLYFISVRGGSRPLQQQTHLLKQMEKVARIYGAKFVVNISELGEDDPLMQNGTLHFPSLKVPWYSTSTSKGKGYFLKQIATPSGQILDIIVLETSSLQVLVLFLEFWF
uniref:Uncharacterized protein n=1 Tax=Nelumbo nucifera TaxID=4432 RepID=A0A822YCY9_NELNU|nr:TPA_asm: hypothetical protein HUJ06_028836 [Nelumbo nucifera]